MSRSVYLAGPDVFYPDAQARGVAMQAVCQAMGWVGLYPLDAALPANPPSLSRAIYEANRNLIDRADAVVAFCKPGGMGVRFTLDAEADAALQAAIAAVTRTTRAAGRREVARCYATAPAIVAATSCRIGSAGARKFTAKNTSSGATAKGSERMIMHLS